MGGVRGRAPRRHGAKRKPALTTASQNCKHASLVSKEDALERLQDGYTGRVKNTCLIETTSKTPTVSHPSQPVRLIRKCSKDWMLLSCSNVAKQYQRRYTHNTQAQKTCRSVLTHIILVASALACQLAYLPPGELSQWCDGLPMVDAVEGGSESTENPDYRGGGDSQLHGSQGRKTTQPGYTDTLSEAYTARILSGERRKRTEPEVVRTLATAARGADRMLTSAASKELSTSLNEKKVVEGDHHWRGATEEIRYWEHLAGEARPALAFLLEDTLAQAICPSSESFAATTPGTAPRCVARRLQVKREEIRPADNPRLQASIDGCTGGSFACDQKVKRQWKTSGETSEGIFAQLLQKQGKGPTDTGKSGDTGTSEGHAELGAKPRTKRAQIISGIQGVRDSTRQPTIQSPPLFLTRGKEKATCFSTICRQGRLRSSVTRSREQGNCPAGETQKKSLFPEKGWPSSLYPSVPLIGTVGTNHTQDNENPSGRQRYTDDVVVFKAPQFTTKIRRHVDKILDEVKPYEAPLETDGRGSLVEETALARWSGLTRSHTLLLISRLQEHLDSQCAAADAARGGKRIYSRFHRDDYYCFEEKELDFSKRGLSCVDSCGVPIRCRGRVNVYMDEVWRSRPLEVDIQDVRLKGLYCVVSRLQARLNELCGTNGFVWRVRNGVDSCVNIAHVDWRDQGAFCVDNCGKPTRCYGVPRVFVPNKDRDQLEKRKKEEIQKLCICDEDIPVGGRYNGCQTVTRSGRTCQKWKSNEPHAHVELSMEDHNYCRNPYGEKYIWCYTTDPQVRFDYCDPLGIKNQYIQPQEKLDVVLTGRDLNPYVALRIFSRAPNEAAACGPKLRQRNTSNLLSFLSQTAGDGNLPHVTTEGGTISALTWDGLSVSNQAAGSVTLCGCNYWYLESSRNNDTPCSRDEDFTILLGSVQIVGPTYPGDVVTRLTTTDEREVTLRGEALSVGDLLTVISGTNPKDCTRRNQFTVEMEALGGTPKALETDSTVVVRTTLVQVVNQGREAKSSPLRVPTTGRYMLCWNGARQDFSSTAVAENLLVTGFNSNQNFVLVRSPFHQYSSLQQSTLYISTYRSDARIEPDAVTIREASTPPCQGKEIGRSIQIKMLNTLSTSDVEEKLYKASCVLGDTPREANSEEVTLLDVCVRVGSTARHLGHGTVGTTYLYNFSEFTTPATLHPAAPDGVFTYEVDADSPLSLHWTKASNTEENIIVDFASLFQEGPFPKALSFWVNRVQGHITAWAFDPADPAPDLALIWKVPNAKTAALDVCVEHVHLYVVTGQPAQLHMFDVSNPAVGTLDRPLATLDGRARGFVDLCSVVLIYSTFTSDCEPLILLLDKGSGFLHMYDARLTPVLSTTFLDGMSTPMSQPSSLSCTPRPSASTELLNTWDCVIADSGSSAIIYFRVYPVTKQIIFVQEYYGESFKEGRNTSLSSPHAVVAHKYTDKTLIYVAEAGKPDMHLLVVNSNEDAIRFEAFVSATDNIPSIRHMFILPLHLYSQDPEDVLLATFREGITGPQLQYGPLSTTGRIPEFFYQPREWYGVGDVQVLEPLARGGGSLERIHEYVLEDSSRSSAYTSSIAAIDRKTGVLRLFISHIKTQVVSIKVVGIGLVNKQVSELLFRVACRDGYYAKDGICVKCAAGTYNSMLLVAENPQVAWSACQACPPAHSTVAEGSVSSNQCQCQKGYQVDDTGSYCVPCPPGTWKDTVANTGCHGKCPPHSSTTVQGATTPEERRCECEPGYYYYNAGENEGCVKAPEGFFSPGGYMAELIRCPRGTTNMSDTPEEVAATTLSSCFCEKGYTPASAEALRDPNSAASLLRNYLKSFPEYARLQDHQVCVKCDKDSYKDVVGNQLCLPCPKSSYSSASGATSLGSCSQCVPGYYQTGELSKPCKKCPKDHFCVGSDPTIPALTRYANKMKACPPFSKMGLHTANNHPLKCMCRMGYEPQSVGVDLMVTCMKTRLNHYKDVVSNKPGTPCPSNRVTEMTKTISPVECICPPGQYLNKESDECEPCPQGFYCLGKRDLNDYSDVQPIQCPPLTSTHDVGASDLSQCLCDRGFHRTQLQTGVSKDVQCSPCPQNTYKDWVGDSMCSACGENSGTRSEGATSAAQCLCFKGYYYSYTLLRCTACGGNSTKYCPGGEEPCDPGDPHCVDGKKPAEPKPCPENTRIPAGFDVASSVGDCKCEPGFAYKSEGSRDKRTNCVPCPPGSYKPYVQNTACNSLCGASATSFAGARSQSQCFCEEGTFRVGETCHSCPTGAVCAGGLLPEAELKIKNDPQFTQITPAHHVKPFAKPGFFLSKLREELLSLNDWRFTACPIQKACLKEGVCVETMTEYLCSECRPNFTSNFAKGEMCTACPSMGWNISLITVYYLGILLFNIVMTYMNVAAGFNRRSIHSIVIKIASNFLTCMSVVGALDFNNIRLPDWAARLTTRVTAQVTVERRVQWLSVDCLLRQGFHLSYPDSFFYTMLFYALLPIVLPIFATAIMYVLVSRMQAWYRVSTKRKLNLINQAELCGLTALSEQLRERCAQDRVFLIFRYIPLPGESRLTRFAKFMEDMIPIYVTVLFFLHSPTTTQMLSLLDCTYMDFGRGHKAKYFLRAAMSVECEFGPGKPYFKYLALGIVGLCIWSIGIPLSGFMVLYMNRKNLYSRATRLKYGFLHNGFLKKYWYWETVAFARKFLVLMSTSVGLIHSKNTGYTRIWTAMLISIVFLVFHLIAQPFDKRSYLTLDRLETHSMGIWTVTCVIMAMMLGSDFSGNINMTLLCILVLLAALFLLEVAFSLMIAYFDNVRAQKTFFTVPVLGRLFKFFGRLSEKRRAHEPVVIYDAENEVFQLVAAKRHGWQIFSKKADKIYLAERDYFIKVLAETLWFAVAHMKLNVIPGAFLEFILLLGMTIHKMDESSQENKKSLQAIADGDLSRLTEWSRNEHAKKEDAKRVREQKRETKRRLGNFYRRFGMGLHRRRKPHFQEQSYEDKEVMAERIQDLEGTTLADETSSDGSGQNDDKEVSVQHLDDEVDDASISSALPSLADGSVGDLEDGTLLFIDKEQMTTGIVLSELYLALLKLQQKESSGIGNQYEVFRSQRLSTAAAQAEQLLDKNKKLKLIRFAFQSLITSTPEELQKLCVDEKSFAEKRKELAELNAQIKLLNDRLQELGTDPEKLDKEIGEEWIDKEDFDCLAAQQDAASQEFDMGDGEEWIDKEDFDCLAAQQDAASQEFDMGDGDSEEEGQRANDHEYNMEP